MSILANGKRMDGSPLVPPMEDAAFGEEIVHRLGANLGLLAAVAQGSARGGESRDEIERKPSVDLNDPRAAGWTYLIRGTSRDADAVIDAVRPLAEFRGMKDPAAPLQFLGESPHEWMGWLDEHYFSLSPTRPYYVLLVGGPAQIPFLFQSVISTVASVGRVSFESLDDLATYIDKVIRLEKASQPATDREAIVFAPDGGPRDATYYSRKYLAEPILERLQRIPGLKITSAMGDNASKAALVAATTEAHPALVFTASHGLGDPELPFEQQKRLNGAICCQADGPYTEGTLYTADDVPADGAFLEGSAFFQFACYGYGTPAQSDFHHWLGNPAMNARRDFVAALPRRLLAHPRGPVSYVGHLDAAWLHGFADPVTPDISDPYHARIAPFVEAVRCLLDRVPAGVSMSSMRRRSAAANALLTSTWDQAQRGELKMTRETFGRVAEAFITRSDAQNYMIFGDPAVAVRMPKTDG